MITKRRIRCLPLALILSFSTLASTQADETAVAFDTTRHWSSGGGHGVYGWQFTTQSNMQISALGVYDNPSSYGGGFPDDGFLESHAVGIWAVSNPSTLLATAFLPAGTSATLLNGFRYASISPVILLAGHKFVIAARYEAEDLTTGLSNNPTFVLTLGSGITFDGYRSSSSPGFAFPDLLIPDHIYGFGPNFTYSIVPEPAALSLCALTGMVLFLRLKRRIE